MQRAAGLPRAVQGGGQGRVGSELMSPGRASVCAGKLRHAREGADGVRLWAKGSARGRGPGDDSLPLGSLPLFFSFSSHAGCRCIMSRLGALGGSRAGLGLLLGTAAGLGFLCVLYSRRWKRARRHGRSHSLPDSLDRAQASERGGQGKSTGHYLLMALGLGLSLAEPMDWAVEGLSFTL